jgi:hypothetical protein
VAVKKVGIESRYAPKRISNDKSIPELLQEQVSKMDLHLRYSEGSFSKWQNRHQ